MIRCLPFEEIDPSEILFLEEKMKEFYSHPPAGYYELAHGKGETYCRPAAFPFHHHLLSYVKKGMKVADFGCGRAEIYPEIEKRGASYTGFDWSENLLEQNRKQYPKAIFKNAAAKLEERFDLVISLYTMEHIPRPGNFLDQLYRSAAEGGIIGIICPEFVDSDGFPPSFYYGNSAHRLREKLLSFNWIDAARHWIDVQWSAPKWRERARRSKPGTFWINLKPRCLEAGTEFSIDSDAVYMARKKDMEWWFQEKGCLILEGPKEVDPEVSKFNCSVIAQKLKPEEKRMLR
jgi:SAM-dependent methyltransferase